MSLPSFTFTGNLKSIGIAVAGVLSTAALTKAQVQFQSNLRPDRLLVFGGVSYTPPDIVYGDIADDATIQANDGTTDSVKLLANSSGLAASVSGIQWTVSILVPAPGGTRRITQTFLAPQDGDTIDLANIVPLALTNPIYGDSPAGGIDIIDGGTL
jgi:hypothetical protein